jgi:hypothetical protein
MRAHVRYHVDLKVLVTAGPKLKPGVFWADVRSLGEGGLGAEIPVPLGEGHTVLLDLLLWNQYVTLPASVRYHTGTLHGFQFLDVTQEQRAVIRQYCETLL